MAERLGVSPRRLWGEQPEVRLIPDGGGFVVERGREFTRDDIDLFEAARIAEESLSPRGIEFVDEMDPANERRFRTGDDAGLPSRNYAVAAQERARRAYEKAYPDADMAGLVWPVRLV